MKRFLLLAACLFPGLSQAAPPNVVLILSDDQSWNDYSFMGHEVIQTPRLDKFAKESLTYTRGYVTSPLCRPSLASIFTGMATPHHGITGNDISLDPDDVKGKKLNSQLSRASEKYGPRHESLYANYRKHQKC